MLLKLNDINCFFNYHVKLDTNFDVQLDLLVLFLNEIRIK